MVSVKKRILLGLALLVLLLIVLSLVVLIPTRNDLTRARKAFGGPLNRLTDERAEEAKQDIESALSRLDGFSGKILGAVPVMGTNLDAIEGVSEAVLPAIDAGLELKTKADEIEDDGVLSEGRFQLESFAELEAPLAEQVDTLTALEEELEAQKSSSLWPSLWETFTDLHYDIRTIREDADSLRLILEEIDSMLGAEGKRTYLILLLNNAELRGAGGALTGVGTITADDGELKLGDFTSVHALRTAKHKTVDVPKDYERYNIYEANDAATWINASYSPDVVDSATVAARLYEKVTGTKTHGAIAVDPRGIAALMPGDTEIDVPKIDETIETDDVADFVYSDAYEEFDDQQERRAAILEVGARAFAEILDADLDDQDDLERVADAFGAGHIRFISFDPKELRALNTVNATGSVPDLKSDGVLVAVQNRGGAAGIGSKMDYWADRKVTHGCSLEAGEAVLEGTGTQTEEAMKCVTRVELTNDAPEGLPAYVTGKVEPYALMRSLVEVYVPAAAKVTGLTRNGEPIGRITGNEGNWQSSGIYVEIPLGETAVVEIVYALPLEGDYSLEMLPQPLARDASVELALKVPRDWTVRGPGRWEDSIYRFRGEFDQAMTVKAFPTERKGLSAFWESLGDFWNDPLF
jgi:Protein of unknown function (DUF4012)